MRHPVSCPVGLALGDDELILQVVDEGLDISSGSAKDLLVDVEALPARCRGIAFPCVDRVVGADWREDSRERRDAVGEPLFDPSQVEGSAIGGTFLPLPICDAARVARYLRG